MKGFIKRELLLIASPVYDIDSVPGINDGRQTSYTYVDDEYFVGAHTAGIGGKELLVLRIYEQSISYYPEKTAEKSARELRWSVYISFEEKDFTTYDHKTGGWRDAMVHNLLGYSSWYYKKTAYINDDSRRLAGLLRGEPDRDTLDVVSDWQSAVRDNSLQARTARERRKIDALMEQAAELPADIDRYIDDVALRAHRFSYYRREGKTIHGFCTYCHRDYKLPAPRGSLVGKSGMCPLCGSEVQYKAAGAAADIRVCESFSFACRVNDGLFITQYNAWRWFTRDIISKYYYRNITKPHIEKVCRKYISLSGAAATYMYNDSHKKFDNGVKWNKNGERQICCPLYPDNLSEVVAGTRWKYSALELYARQVRGCDAENYLRKVYYYPVLEKVVKVGLHRLVRYIIDNNTRLFNCEINDLRPALGLNMDEIHMLADARADADMYVLYTTYRGEGVRLKAEELMRARRLGIAKNLFDGGAAGLRNAASVARILGYAEAQLTLDGAKTKDARHWSSGGYFVNDWRDYLNDCAALGLDWLEDKSVMCPRDLAAAHASTIERLAAARTAKFDSGFKKHCAGWEGLYTYTDGTYLVRPARSAAELEVEGRMLHHCVARYAADMAAGKTLILFVRSAAEPDVPLATGEIRDGNIVQFRAVHNRTPPAPVLKFWEKCKQEFNRRAAEAERAKAAAKSARKGRVKKDEQRDRVGA